MLKGIFPVLPTCFTDEGGLFPEAQKKVVQFALTAGAHGIVFPGVASEYNFLTAEERGFLMKLVVDEVNGQVPVVAGVSASDPQEVILLGQQALQNGIHHMMLMAPNHLEQNIFQHQKFFNTITEALPGCEIILQNAPTPIGAGLKAQQLLEIIQNNPAIRYVKEETLPSGPTITALLKHPIPHLLGVFGGGGARYIIDELNRGALGAVPAVEIADLHVALFEAYQKKEFEKARNYYQLSLPLLTAQKIYRMRLTKYVLQWRGVVSALKLRAPSPELDAYAQKDINQLMADLNQAKALTWKE